jgi:Ulp1 family protease
MSATILEVDRVIMPVHLGNHWTCAVIDLAAQELVYYDSMGVRFEHLYPGTRSNVTWSPGSPAL